MARPDVKVIVGIVENMLKMPVWHDTFMLRRAHSRILSKLNEFKDKQDLISSAKVSRCERVPLFVEIYQNNLGIITLSRILTSLGDSAFGKNIYSSYRLAKISAESQQKNQKYIAFVEVMVLPNCIKEVSSDSSRVELTDGAISLSNVKGAYFRGVYYRFDLHKKMFIRN